jgi:hypothetical protein
MLSFSIDVSTIIVTSSYRKINSKLSLLRTSSKEPMPQAHLVRCSPIDERCAQLAFYPRLELEKST